MIRDTFGTFATAVASGDVGTRQFGDVIDLQGLGPTTNVGTNLGGLRDAGAGQNVRVVASVNEAYTGSVPIVTFSVVTSANPNLTGYLTLLTTPANGATQLIAGARILNACLPTEGVAYARYLGVIETVVGTTTTGKMDIGLQLDDVTTPKAYAQGDVAF